jgi:hypothetical protein
MRSIYTLDKVITLVRYNLEYKRSIFKRLSFIIVTKLYLYSACASTLLTL